MRYYNQLMIDTHPSRPLRCVIAVATIAIAGLVNGTALAGGSLTQAQKGALPGVTSDYSIAKPAPVPEPDEALPSGGNSQFKIGDMDVRISGSITVDVGVGATGLPRRK